MQPKEKRKSVAVLVDHLYNYQMHVLNGIRDHLEQQGIATFVYLGRELNTARTSWLKANDLYTLVHPENHSGMIVLSASLSTHSTPEHFQDFLQQYDLPKVCVGKAISGIPSVISDNVPGMQDLMEHLIVTRGSRRFVFMGGIRNNFDAQEREQVFLDSLKKHGLEVPAEFMLNGDFQSILAHIEMGRLLEKRQDFDVVVSCNDEMTEGIIQALTEHHLRVPEDVAVVGFDDNDDFRYAIPALTTVRMPFYEQGEQAAALLLQQLEGAQAPLVSVLPTQLVVRHSCGHVATLDSSDLVPVSLDLQARLKQEFMQRAPQIDQHPQFLSIWKRTILSEIRAQHDIHIWQDWIEARRREMPAQDLMGQHSTDVLCFQLQKFLIQAQQMVLARQSLLGAFEADTKWHLDMALMSQSNYTGLYTQIQQYLQTLKLSRSVLVVYEIFSAQPAAFARAVLAEGIQCPLDSSLFPTQQLLPEAMQAELGRGNLVMTALFSGDEHFGYLLFEQPETLYFIEESFRQAISWAFHRLDQSLAMQDYTEGLEKQVALRTRQLQAEVRERQYAEMALQAANAELQRYAFLDGLTGIYNRAAFDDHLNRIWQDHLHKQQVFSVLLCDVDFFKLYNDHHGHLKGDQCLKDVAALLKRCVHNPGDVVARYGGEEFVILLPESTLADALTVADRIHQALREAAIPHMGSRVGPQVTISIGAVAQCPETRLNPTDLLEQADQLLYQSKKHGRSRTSWEFSSAEGPLQDS